MHWEIPSVVHIVPKRSNDPELSIPELSILRDHSVQVRVRGTSTYEVRVYAVGSLLTTWRYHLALSLASYDTGRACGKPETTKPWKLSFCI